MGLLKSLLAVCCLCALGCNNETTTTVQAPTATTETDTINYALNEDSIKLQLANTTPPEGFYQVMLPCTNCKGIEHTVLFNPDLTFRLEEHVLGSDKTRTKTTGIWKPANGDIWLYKDKSVVARYTWKGDTLNYIDLESDVRIPLRQLPNAADNTAWKNKKDSGIEFYGVGNEPFWNITIDEQRMIVLMLADIAKRIPFKPVKPFLSVDSTVYQTRNDSATLRVVIYNTFCSDGMSDNIYNNKVKVLYKDKEYNGCGIVYK
jgi:uncharacterized membrane protein/uncharacterized lipoprotein NlpE involved in copper resistance